MEAAALVADQVASGRLPEVLAPRASSSSPTLRRHNTPCTTSPPGLPSLSHRIGTTPIILSRQLAEVVVELERQERPTPPAEAEEQVILRSATSHWSQEQRRHTQSGRQELLDL